MRWLTAVLCLAGLSASLPGAPAPVPKPPSPEKASRERVNRLLTSMRDGTYRPGDFPALSWEDVPALLERASREDLLRSFPSNPLSSYAPTSCREGVLALWLIEGVRRGGEWPSLTPLLRGRVGMVLTPEAETEVLHRLAFHAYRAWWDRVKGLPPARAAAVAPLAGTDLSWY
jgi:hypothetical protein